MRNLLLVVVSVCVAIAFSSTAMAAQGKKDAGNGEKKAAGVEKAATADSTAPAENGARRERPVPPVVAALDANSDSAIDTAEMDNASAALKKLDKNSDGKLEADELRPERPAGATRGQGRGNGQGAERGNSQGGERGNGQGTGNRRQMPITTALDTNSDGTIDATEISAATAALKKLDKNNDGKLERSEYQGERRSRNSEAPAA